MNQKPQYVKFINNTSKRKHYAQLNYICYGWRLFNKQTQKK